MMIVQLQLIVYFRRLRFGGPVCKVLGHFVCSLNEDSGQSRDHLLSVSVADEGEVDQLVRQDLGGVASTQRTRNLENWKK